MVFYLISRHFFIKVKGSALVLFFSIILGLGCGYMVIITTKMSLPQFGIGCLAWIFFVSIVSYDKFAKVNAEFNEDVKKSNEMISKLQEEISKLRETSQLSSEIKG